MIYDGCSDYDTPAGTVILAGSPPDDEMIAECKRFCEKRGLTSEDVKIVRDKFGIQVITKRDLCL